MKDFEKIKRSRLPEAFLIEMINGMSIIKQDRYTDSVFYEFNGRIIFEHSLEHNSLAVSIDLIWSVFYKKYGYKHEEIQSLINSVVEEYTEMRGISSRNQYILSQERWDSILSSYYHDNNERIPIYQGGEPIQDNFKKELIERKYDTDFVLSLPFDIGVEHIKNILDCDIIYFGKNEKEKNDEQEGEKFIHQQCFSKYLKAVLLLTE